MPPDLIETLNEHIQNIEQLTRERSDARLTNTLHANTPLLALWKSARHVKRIPRKKAASAKAGSESSEG